MLLLNRSISRTFCSLHTAVDLRYDITILIFFFNSCFFLIIDLQEERIASPTTQLHRVNKGINIQSLPAMTMVRSGSSCRRGVHLYYVKIHNYLTKGIDCKNFALVVRFYSGFRYLSTYIEFFFGPSQQTPRNVLSV